MPISRNRHSPKAKHPELKSKRRLDELDAQKAMKLSRLWRLVIDKALSMASYRHELYSLYPTMNPNRFIKEKPRRTARKK